MERFNCHLPLSDGAGLIKTRVSTRQGFHLSTFLGQNLAHMSLITCAVKRDVTVSSDSLWQHSQEAVEEFTTESLIGSILINSASKKGKAKWDDNFASEARNFR